MKSTGMRVYVIGDTHGRTEKAIEIFYKLKDIDLIVHLGDFWKDAENLKRQLQVPVMNVKGNMDGCFSKDEYKILETDFGKIYIAHLFLFCILSAHTHSMSFK